MQPPHRNHRVIKARPFFESTTVALSTAATRPSASTHHPPIIIYLSLSLSLALSLSWLRLAPLRETRAAAAIATTATTTTTTTTTPTTRWILKHTLTANAQHYNSLPAPTSIPLPRTRLDTFFVIQIRPMRYMLLLLMESTRSDRPTRLTTTKIAQERALPPTHPPTTSPSSSFLGSTEISLRRKSSYPLFRASAEKNAENKR